MNHYSALRGALAFTFGLTLAVAVGAARAQSLNDRAFGVGDGTVTSVTCGAGMTGGTIIASGTCDNITPQSDQTSSANPTAPASTSAYKMQGLAGSVTLGLSGNLLIIITGTCHQLTVTAGDGIQYQISYGTGSAPANADALAGTQVGPIQICTNTNTNIIADTYIPFSITAVVTGLTPGTPYWIDLAAESVATVSSGQLKNVAISAVEF